MAELLEQVGHNVRRLREKKGWNQTELGFYADTSPSIVSLIENGKRNPSTTTLARLARALSVTITELFQEAEPGKVSSPLPSVEEPFEQWRLSYLSAWSNCLSEIANDAEEWRYQWVEHDSDPADLPERDFLMFVGGVVTLGQNYRQLSRTVYEELVPALQSEPQTPQTERQIERLEKAFRRLSRAILSIATPATQQRIERMEQDDITSEAIRSNMRVLRELSA